MLTFILRRMRASTVMLAPFEKLQRRLLKAALGLFGSADNAPRVQVGCGWWQLGTHACFCRPAPIKVGIFSPTFVIPTVSMPLNWLQAVLLVRQMALELPQPALEYCLKVGNQQQGVRALQQIEDACSFVSTVFKALLDLSCPCLRSRHSRGL